MTSIDMEKDGPKSIYCGRGNHGCFASTGEWTLAKNCLSLADYDDDHNKKAELLLVKFLNLPNRAASWKDAPEKRILFVGEKHLSKKTGMLDPWKPWTEEKPSKGAFVEMNWNPHWYPRIIRLYDHGFEMHWWYAEAGSSDFNLWLEPRGNENPYQFIERCFRVFLDVDVLCYENG